MPQEFFSIEQVAQCLNLQVRTVRTYVRGGKLTAVRIGKQYRITREDLEALTGKPMTVSKSENTRRRRHVEASSIVQIDAIGADEAFRMANFLNAAAKGRTEDGSPLHIETIYDEGRAQLKIILVGDLSATTILSSLIALRLKEPPP
jgi:excisionase family DNA binding protein